MKRDPSAHPSSDSNGEVIDRELLRLCAGAQDETLSAEEMVELEARLQKDAGARRFYLRLVQLQALLELDPPDADEVALEDSLLSERKVVRLPRFAAVTWLAAAASLAVLLTLGFQAFFGGSRDATGGPAVAVAPRAIATLLFSEDCRWAGASAGLVEGQRIVPSVLSLKEGMAVLRFDGGAEMILSGETEVELLSPKLADLRHGEVVVRAEDGAEGFTLGTPSEPLVDLGTEFAVRVRPSGETELHVHEGEVAVGAEIITAGRAIRMNDPAKVKSLEEMTLDAPRFAEVVKKANPKPRADLMKIYEGFHYEPGELPLAESTVGKGWAGSWRLRREEELRRPEKEGTSPFLNIVHGQLNVTWPVPGGRLGMLQMAPGGSFYVRDLAKPLRMDVEGVFFISLMVREMERYDKRAKQGGQEALRLTFRDSRDYWNESLSFGHGPNFKPQIQSGVGLTSRSPIMLPEEETSLWVAKVVTRKQGPDEIYFRVYHEADPLDYAEPAEWHVVSRDLEIGAQFDRVLLSSTGRSPRIVDELRIGPTWRSVAPLKPDKSVVGGRAGGDAK